MTEIQQYRPETKEAEPKQRSCFILSENGFGGRKYRLAKRYLAKTGEAKMTWSTSKEDAAFITQVTVSNNAGELTQITARTGDKKVRVAIFQPADQQDFDEYLQARKPTKGKVFLTDFQSAGQSPTAFAISVLDEWIQSENLVLTPAEKMKRFLDNSSFFPIQNSEIIIRRLEKAVAENKPFRIGCFVCLNMKCLSFNDQPIYFVGQKENRLETPRLTRRTKEIIGQLEETGIDFTLDFLLADTDPLDIYGEWLGQQDLESEINKYQSRLEKTIAIVSNSKFTSVKRWSTIQTPFAEQYQEYFQLAVETSNQLVGWEYINASAKRRLQYFNERVGLPYSEKIAYICEITAKRNIALYAAQGPILNDTYDLLVIADPDPMRLGKIQSLFCPDLPIWYPYPG